MPGVTDRVALVTGAAQGIGAAIAKRLAAGGAKVGVLDLQREAADAVAQEITAAGGSAIGLGADVSQREQVQAAVDTLVEKFGGLQILVNNAGVLRDNLLFKMGDDDWDTVMNVHLKGAFLCSSIAQKHMVAAKYGRIVSMSSTSAPTVAPSFFVVRVLMDVFLSPAERLGPCRVGPRAGSHHRYQPPFTLIC